MKLVPIIMDYCLLEFGALKFFLWVYVDGPDIKPIHQYGESQPNFNFFNVNPQIFQQNRKVDFTECLERNFHNIPIISLRIIRHRNYS